MPGHNAGKQHKGNSQGDTENLDFSQKDSRSNHHRIEQNDVCYGIGIE